MTTEQLVSWFWVLSPWCQIRVGVRQLDPQPFFIYVTSSYPTWIFCRGVSGFATDCPCDVWCRGLTTCLLHVGPSFGNRFLNTSWAVCLTYWIVYHHVFVFWHMQLYMSWYIISFFGFIFTSSIFFILSSTPVLTSSIDVVFVLSIWIFWGIPWLPMQGQRPRTILLVHDNATCHTARHTRDFLA